MVLLYEDKEKKYNNNENDFPEKKDNSLFNLSNYDIHNFENDEKRKEILINTIKEYGCGSCSPRNFYVGTLGHVSLEEEIKKFII